MSSLAGPLEDTIIFRIVNLSDKISTDGFKGLRKNSFAVISGFRDAPVAVKLPANSAAEDLYGNHLKSPLEYKGTTLYITPPGAIYLTLPKVGRPERLGAPWTARRAVPIHMVVKCFAPPLVTPSSRLGR